MIPNFFRMNIRETVILIAVSSVIATLFVLVIMSVRTMPAVSAYTISSYATCAYLTAAQAQDLLYKGAANLDRDKDGKACER